MTPATDIRNAAVDESLSLGDALRTVAVNSAYHTSRSLSKWFKRGVRLSCDGFEELPLAALGELAGPPDSAIVAVRLPLEGELAGDVLLVFPEKAAYSLVDILLCAPDGTTREFGELEYSCLQETGNIVASAFTNSLANWLKLQVHPASPLVAHDLALAIIDPLVAAVVGAGDTVLVAKTLFEFDKSALDCRLLLLPSTQSLAIMQRQCESERLRRCALQTIAVNGAFDASRAMSKWLKRGVRLETDGFKRIALHEATHPPSGWEDPVVALRMDLHGQIHGHTLIMMPQKAALEMVDVLMGDEPGTRNDLDDMARSCLQETGNIISGSFMNSWAKWMEIQSEPDPPKLIVDMYEAIFEGVMIEQARLGDEVFMAEADFTADGRSLQWAFFILPTPASLRMIEMAWS